MHKAIHVYRTLAATQPRTFAFGVHKTYDHAAPLQYLMGNMDLEPEFNDK
jgi:hypothetical protein